MKDGNPLNHEWIKDGQHIRKCPTHNCWMKTNRYTKIVSCERCLMDREAKQREWDKTGGSNKPPVRIGKL